MIVFYTAVHLLVVLAAISFSTHLGLLFLLRRLLLLLLLLPQVLGLPHLLRAPPPRDIALQLDDVRRPGRGYEGGRTVILPHPVLVGMEDTIL